MLAPWGSGSPRMLRWGQWPPSLATASWVAASAARCRRALQLRHDGTADLPGDSSYTSTFVGNLARNHAVSPSGVGMLVVCWRRAQGRANLSTAVDSQRGVASGKAKAHLFR